MHFSADFYHPLHRLVPGAAGMLGASSGLTIPVDIPPFHFQPRRISVDWRRFSAIDVERVAREVDVAMLQEHITSITFCNLDGERCPHCGQPADPVLLKVLRMAQLSIEYLLHCQEHLGTSLAVRAQRLEAARAELASTQQQAAEQAAQLQVSKEESRRWKKLLAMHQPLLQAGPNTYCKCHLCDKAFMNNSFLQAHVQRRHAEATEAAWQTKRLLLLFAGHMATFVMITSAAQLPALHPETLQCFSGILHLTQTKTPIGADRSQPCSQHLCFPSFAERRKMKQVEQMEDEVEELKAKLREVQQQLEAEKEMEKLHREKETERAHQREEEGRRDLERWKEEERTKLHKEIDGLKQLFLAAFKDMASRSSAMEGKLQELHAREVLESNLGTLRDDDTEEAWWQASGWAERERMAVQKESKTLRGTPSQDQWAVMGCVHQQMDAFSTHLREQPKLTKSQEKKIKLLSTGKTEATQDVTKVEADEESAGREEATRGGKQRLLEALRRNTNLLKRFRHILEEVLEEKLESMGVKRVAKGISTRTYKRLQAVVRLQQQQKAVKFPGLLHLRDELVQALMGKVRRRKKHNSALPQQLSVIPARSQKTPRFLCGSKPTVISATVVPEATVITQPVPWSRASSTHSPSRTPSGTLGTTKASRPHRVVPWRSLQTMQRRNTVRGCEMAAERKRSSSVTKSSSEVMLGGKQPTLSPVRLRPKQKPVLSAVVPGDETDSHGSDLDSREETASSGTATSRMVRLLERRLDAVSQRPSSRVKLFPAGSSASPSIGQPTKKLQFAGDSSDLETSFLEGLAKPSLMFWEPPRSPGPRRAGLQGDNTW
ncbi:LOW QUALITY PROTEIN: zinc finger protein DZIP1L [Strigops habroptila]|uniref:LOW QUALITY PROTEIN: zinc finger protein DZIP1L n=1 Tax=Strigops habroptila TaxID=2489341 RepID=UPI0011D02779|nr:LOW QUALITY PROTEIN: zinc finger protein DZIP1L [Strigops habroptila]